jgi:hypothetical protein
MKTQERNSVKICKSFYPNKGIYSSRAGGLLAGIQMADQNNDNGLWTSAPQLA